MRVRPKATVTLRGVPCLVHEHDTSSRELDKFGFHYYKYWHELSKEIMVRSGIFEVSGPPPPTPTSRCASSSVVVAKEVDEGDVEYWAYFDDDDEWVKLHAW